jgi:guanine deaminase
LPIQSHISENLGEIAFTLEIFPGHKNYAEVYNTAGLLTNKCIMAHGVHLTDDEVKLFAQKGTAVAHCPNSNSNLSSGLTDVKRLIENGVKVGLGTDISGGNRIGILDTLRAAMDVSQHLNFIKKQDIQGTGKVPPNEANSAYVPINYKQALFLATLGGAQTCAIDQKVGNFVKGKDFDALLIDVYAGSVDKFNIPTKVTEKLTPEDKFLQKIQKFVYVGDDRNITGVYVKGTQIK